MQRMKNIQYAVDPQSLPWVPLGPGESFKPLRFSARNRVLLLRVDPGTVIPRHRHLGEVHALNVSGHRELLDTGEIVGPGGYVYEPVGNVDSWRAIGDEPVIVHIASYGAMEYLDRDGRVLERHDETMLRETYLRYCAEHGIEPLELGE